MKRVSNKISNSEPGGHQADGQQARACREENVHDWRDDVPLPRHDAARQCRLQECSLGVRVQTGASQQGPVCHQAREENCLGLPVLSLVSAHPGAGVVISAELHW